MSLTTSQDHVLRNTLDIDGQYISTTHGKVAVFTTGSDKSMPALLLIHGNSLSSELFRHIMHSALQDRHQIVALELLGHGCSDNASKPEAAYNMPAFARCCIEVTDALGLRTVVVLGSSLGGHIGIEMIPMLGNERLKGLMIIGTPPIGHGEVDEGFTFGDRGWKGSYAARSGLTDSEMEHYSRVWADPPYEPWMTSVIKRADAQFRGLMFRHLIANKGVDNRKTVEETTDIPVAVVNGAKEPFINLEFCRNVKYGNLWKGKCIEMEGLLHAPFWGDPDRFQPILEEFMKDCSA